MAKVSHKSNFENFSFIDVTRVANLTYLSVQSCHIGEEDEGGEEGGEEPSFEVRQTEMVWGGLGLGPWESAEPAATATAPSTH